MTKMILNRRLQKNKKKGFTLIELIVVIVIIAIIAAIAVPALTRYIESANKRAAQATAHNIQVVLQAEVSDFYDVPITANSGLATVAATTSLFNPPAGFTWPSNYEGPTIMGILEGSGIYILPAELTNIEFDGRKLTTFTYTHNGDAALKIKYLKGTFDFVEPPAP